MARSKKRALDPKSTTIVEWIAAGLGALMLTGAISYLLYTAAVSSATEPDVAIVVGATSPGQGGYAVAFKAQNRSSFSAAKVRIRGELRSSGELVETAETELDYLPAFSSRSAGLYFRHDPREGRLELFPVSYTDP